MELQYGILYNKILLFHFICIQIHLTSIVSAQSIPGSGNSFDVTNSNAYTTIPNFGQLSTPLTISMWVKYVPNTNTQVIFSSDNNSTVGYNGFIVHILSNHRVRINTGNGLNFTNQSRRTVFTTIPQHLHNQWIHIAIVLYAIQDADIYINGISFPTSLDGTGQMVMTHSTNPIAQIGSVFASNNQRSFLESEIDEIVLWDTSLTQAQIREYMCKKVPPSTPNLYAYYKFDEQNTNGPLIDSSPNGRNGNHVNGGGRVLSGAYIGDESGYTYNPAGGLSWSNSFSESFDVVNPSTNVQGVHVYTVEDNPNHYNGIGADSVCTLGRYHGVFFAPSTSANATASLSINGSGPYGGAYRRDANDDTPWNAIAAGLSLGDTMSFPLSNSQELITVSGGQYNSGLPDTIIHCNFPLTIQANDYPGGTITWQHGGTGSTTQVQGPGWYFLEATSNCASLSFNDSVFVMEDTIAVDTLVFLCPGQSFAIGGQMFQDTGTYVFLNNNPQGCDTLYQVIIEQSTDDIVVDTLVQICEGESFVIGGNTFTLDGQYQFTISSPGGCDSVINLTVNVLIDSVLAIEPFDEVICIGQDTILRVFPMNSGLLSWSNGQTGETTTIREGGYYSVTFQGQCGVQEDSIFIEDRDCKPRIFIPTAFTPNGDGRNDRFEVKGDGISDYSIRIFSRWGRRCFIQRAWPTLGMAPSMASRHLRVCMSIL